MCLKSAKKLVSAGLILCVATVTAAPSIAQVSPGAHSAAQPTYNPRAIQLLQRMADAYAHLTALEQRTVFYAATLPLVAPSGPNNTGSSVGAGSSAALAIPQDGKNSLAVKAEPSPPQDTKQSAGPDASVVTDSAVQDKDEAAPGTKLDRNLYLSVAHPNHLRLELREPDPESGKSSLSEWVSDGKTFWTYTDAKHLYTQEPAPTKLHDFLQLQHLDTSSLELLMVFGINPFAELRDEVESVHYDGTETVRGVLTDIVTLRAVQRETITEARLYIGKTDLLLRRLITETTPVTTENSPGRVGDELDVLMDRTGAPPPRPVAPPPQFATSESDVPDTPQYVGPVKVRAAYDNIIVSVGKANAGDFVFEKPVGALLYEPLSHQNGVDKKKKSPKLMDIFHVIKPRKVRKPRVYQG